MKHYTNKELKTIMSNLKDGKTYCAIGKNGCGYGRIWCEQSRLKKNKHYIGWEDYGSSANDWTIKDMRFVLETIFEKYEEITESVWSHYHINYIPKDSKYKGVDHSTSHPNVCGL